MKAISFLGVTDYKETTFVYRGGGECRTRLFPVALCQFLRPAELLVMVTERAKAMWFDKLVEDVRPWNIVPRPVDIPEGHSISDLWTIFAELTKHLNEEEQLVFDITHSFRTLPFLTFLAASYLRVVKRVNLKGVYYGAWEAREPFSNPSLPTDRSPVFDLSPFMDLLALTTATDQFLKTGNGEALARMLPSEDPKTAALADNVTAIAQGLHLLRPMDVSQAAAALPIRIADAASQVALSMPPIAALLGRIESDYGAFGLDRPRDYRVNAKACLVRQIKMVEWYATKGQIVQALSLAREWLPSLLCQHFGVDPLDDTERKDMELLLNGGKDGDRESPRRGRWSEIRNGSQLRTLWSTLANLRNDVLHSGFRKRPRTAQAITEDTKKVIEELKVIALEWKLQ